MKDSLNPSFGIKSEATQNSMSMKNLRFSNSNFVRGSQGSSSQGNLLIRNQPLKLSTDRMDQPQPPLLKKNSSKGLVPLLDMNLVREHHDLYPETSSKFGTVSNHDTETWRKQQECTQRSQIHSSHIEPSVETRYLNYQEVSTLRNNLEAKSALEVFDGVLAEKVVLDNSKPDENKKSPASINFETDTKDTETKPTCPVIQKDSRGLLPADDFSQPKGFVIDFSKKIKVQNLQQASPPSTKVIKNSTVEDSLNFEKLGLQEVNLELDFRSNDGFRQRKYTYLKESCQIGIENSSQKTKKMEIQTQPISKISRRKISQAFQRIIAEEAKVELLKEELVLCYDFSAKDLFECLVVDSRQGLSIENLKLFRQKLDITDQDLKVEDLNTLLKRFGSSGRGIHRRITISDFSKMLLPQKKEYQLPCQNQSNNSPLNFNQSQEDFELNQV